MSHDIQDNRNIRDAADEWDNGGIDFHPLSNVYALMRALLSEADRIDGDLEDIYHAQHIDGATGGALEKWGELVGIKRRSGEADSSLRARIKARARIGKIGTTFEQFVQFTASFLQTDIQNVEFDTPYVQSPATVEVSADAAVYDNLTLTRAQIIDILDDAVPAGHEVDALERGTFRLKIDGEADDPDKGLTSDSISTGGTLAADIV